MSLPLLLKTLPEERLDSTFIAARSDTKDLGLLAFSWCQTLENLGRMYKQYLLNKHGYQNLTACMRFVDFTKFDQDPDREAIKAVDDAKPILVPQEDFLQFCAEDEKTSAELAALSAVSGGFYPSNRASELVQLTQSMKLAIDEFMKPQYSPDQRDKVKEAVDEMFVDVEKQIATVVRTAVARAKKNAISSAAANLRPKAQAEEGQINTD